MKNILLTLLIVGLGISLSAQVKVFTNGRTVVGDNSAISNPTGALQIEKPVDATYYSIYADAKSTKTAMSGTFSSLYLANSDQTQNNYARFNFGDGSNGAGAAIGSRMFDHAGNRATMEFWSRGTTGPLRNRMSIGENGNVMIGTGTPTERLSVNGDAAKVGGGTWATFSDKKLKKDVKSFEDGLEQILKINPVVFKYNGKAGISNTEKEHVGIIAQEMKEIASYTVKEVNVVSYPEIIYKNNDGDVTVEQDYTKPISENVLTFDPNAITYMLVNAVQEQQEMIDEQFEIIKKLRSEMSDLLARVEQESGSELININLDGKDYVGQNQPNPFTGITNIPLNIPTSVSNAKIVVYDLDGKLINETKINFRGSGSVEINLESATSNTLIYNLITDGKKSKSFKMIGLR